MVFSWPLEIAVWGVPFGIVIMLAVWLWQNTQALDPYAPLSSAQPELHVQVVGYDWKWLLIYPRLESLVSVILRLHLLAARDPAYFRYGDAILLHSRARKSDLRDGRHGHEAAFEGECFRRFSRRKHAI